MNSFDISNVDDDGSINLEASDGQIAIELYDRPESDDTERRDIQLLFDLDQAKEIHARLGHLIWVAEQQEL